MKTGMLDDMACVEDGICNRALARFGGQQQQQKRYCKSYYQLLRSENLVIKIDEKNYDHPQSTFCEEEYKIKEVKEAFRTYVE